LYALSRPRMNVEALKPYNFALLLLANFKFLTGDYSVRCYCFDSKMRKISGHCI
jgi:hypothetical protein